MHFIRARNLLMFRHRHVDFFGRKGRAVSYTPTSGKPMGNKPKRERFGPGKKGDAKWVEAVDKWRRKKSVRSLPVGLPG